MMISYSKLIKQNDVKLALALCFWMNSSLNQLPAAKMFQDISSEINPSDCFSVQWYKTLSTKKCWSGLESRNNTNLYCAYVKLIDIFLPRFETILYEELFTTEGVLDQYCDSLALSMREQLSLIGKKGVPTDEFEYFIISKILINIIQNNKILLKIDLFIQENIVH